MSVPTHGKNVQDWVSSRLGDKPLHISERNRRRLTWTGDTLYSYGSHFPLVHLIRTKSGKPSHWIINGDTWSGGWSMTSDHQSAVRQVTGDSPLPSAIIPQSVLDAAGIITSTVEIVHVTKDTWESRADRYTSLPRGATWESRKVMLPGTDVWVHNVTGEVRDVSGSWDKRLPGAPEFYSSTKYSNYEEYTAARQAYESQWTYYPAVLKDTGRRRAMLRWAELDIEQGEDGWEYVHRWERHWLGESLIRAAVSTIINKRCAECSGTGTVEPYIQGIEYGAEGPLTERMDRLMIHDYQRDLSRIAAGHMTEDNMDLAFRRDWYMRMTGGSRILDTCRECKGRGTYQAGRRRYAYYLSGFDHNEPRPSYFFSELPGGNRPTTVDEAYDTLRPATVRLAQEMGRTVLRQGDRWFIEMPDLSTRDLTKMGAERHRRGGPGREKQQAEGPAWFTPRFQRYINMDCWLGGTTHEATEVARVGGIEYARGIVRHVPDGRAPDHVALTLGDRKTWFLCVGNGTPQGR